MKTCPKCQASVSDTAKFCNKCGFNIKKYEEENTEAGMFCEECGAKIPSDSAFCPECGFNLGDKSSLTVDTFDFGAISSMATAQLFEKEGFVVEDDVLTGYTGKKRSIVIRGVDEIYDSAFEGNQTITYVEIEEGIKSIGRKSFASCPSLLEINIPASCKIIYDDTFKNDSLKTLILSKYNKEIVFSCVSDFAKAYFDEIDADDFCEKIDGKVYIRFEKIEQKAQLIKKRNDDKLAEEKRKQEEERARKAREEKLSAYNKYNAGTYHTFGAYNHGIMTKEIDWIVLERNGNKALLISKYIIDRQKFNANSENTCWEKSSIRTWLNSTFYNTAFNSQEKSKILTTSLRNNPNPQHGTSSGNDTYDKIFLLSTDEVNKYFKADNETRCQVTLFAKNNGAYCDGAYFGYWWLRTSGQFAQNATYIFYTGGVSAMGYDVTGTIFGVRPAMWISLD